MWEKIKARQFAAFFALLFALVGVSLFFVFFVQTPDPWQRDGVWFKAYSSAAMLLLALALFWVIACLPHDHLKHPDAANKPWLTYRPWLPEHLIDNRLHQLEVLAFIVLIINLMFLPIAAVIIPELFRRNYQGVVALIFPASGLIAAFFLFRYYQRGKALQTIRLTLDPYPASIGGQCAGHLTLPMTASAGAKFRVVLTCLYDSNNDSDTRQVAQWVTDGYATITRLPQATKLQFCFDLPNHLTPSEPPPKRRYQWQLMVKTEIGQPDYKLSFDIPVFNTAQRSNAAVSDSRTHPDSVTAQQQAIDEVCDEQQHGDIRQWTFEAGRHGSVGFSLMLMSLIFGGSGLYLVTQTSWGPGWFFLFAGVALLPFALYTQFNRLVVSVNTNQIHINRRLLGLPLVRQFIDKSAIKHIAVVKSYSSSDHHQHLIYYYLKLCLRDGRRFIIADALKGESAAQRLAAHIENVLRLNN
jgi:hypothetical protein